MAVASGRAHGVPDFVTAVAPRRAHGAPDLRGLTNAQYAACVADAKRRQLAGVSSSSAWSAICASSNVFTLICSFVQRTHLHVILLAPAELVHAVTRLQEATNQPQRLQHVGTDVALMFRQRTGATGNATMIIYQARAACFGLRQLWHEIVSSREDTDFSCGDYALLAESSLGAWVHKVYGDKERLQHLLLYGEPDAPTSASQRRCCRARQF